MCKDSGPYLHESFALNTIPAELGMATSMLDLTATAPSPLLSSPSSLSLPVQGSNYYNVVYMPTSAGLWLQTCDLVSGGQETSTEQ